MKKTIAMLLCMLMLCAGALAEGRAPIVGNNGLLVMSPEEYLGIDECDHISQEDNWYCYKYEGRGLYASPYGKGMKNPADWYQMKEYVDALVASGYYKVVEYRKPKEYHESWSLLYIGPGSAKRTFKIGTGMSEKATIIVRSFIGDISVYYSLDVITNDIEDTQYRLNEYVFDGYSDTSERGTSTWNPSPSNTTTTRTKDCTRCNNGKVSCTQCNGRGYFEKRVSVPNYSGKGSKYETVKENCGKCRGSKTQDCSTCGGKGKVEY